MGLFKPGRAVSSDGDENLDEHGFHEDIGEENEDIIDNITLKAGSDPEEDDEEDDEDDSEDDDEDVSESEEESAEEGDDGVLISKSKISLAKKLLENIRENNEKLITIFGGLLSEEDEARISIAEISETFGSASDGAASVIEGVFDGQNMIGPDGKEYSMPANYASKSKLVEGDMLKLTITDRGTFVYKQTKPVERKRVIGKLEKDENGNFLVIGDKRKWRVLTASITYFKGGVGDKVVVLTPKAGDSQWAAVENVIKNK